MMKKLLLATLCLLTILSATAQVSVNEGPELGNDEDHKMNRIIDGGESGFYAYRIKTKGKGTQLFIERYEKGSMELAYSKGVAVPDGAKVVDVIYLEGNAYVLYRKLDKDAKLLKLTYIAFSKEGKESSPVDIMNIDTDSNNWIDFDIATNEAKTKMVIKCTNKDHKTSPYKTDFVLFDGTTQNVAWTKTVPKFLKRSNPWFVWGFKKTETTGFLGMYLSDNDDIYYAFNEKLKKDDKKDARYNATVEILKAEDEKPIVTKLDLNTEYLVYDVQFAVNSKSELMLAGFFKDVIERKGRDLVDVGTFTYKINTTSGAIEGQAIKVFDEKILTALESNPKRARRMIYKVDYLIPDGDAFYLVGEQFRINVGEKQGMGASFSNIAALASGANPLHVGKAFQFEYMDVIVAKIDGDGNFEWVANSPLRNVTVINDSPHQFKQYIASMTDDGLYLFYNEHKKNFERIKKHDYKPKDLKNQTAIHGSNMVYSKIGPDGKVEHEIAFKNETYCFAPVQERAVAYLPPEDAEIFVQSGPNELIIYLEDRGKSRFAKLTIE